MHEHKYILVKINGKTVQALCDSGSNPSWVRI